MNDRAVILIADDDERVRVSLSDILLAKRFKVIHATNGEETLEKVQSASPDVILLDINMPEPDGLEVIKRLKADKNSRFIPIIIITGKSDFDIRIQALNLGADDFLVKPPHVAELIARVQTLVKVKAYYDHMKRYQSILEAEVRKRTDALNEAHEKLKKASLETIYRLSRAAEYKDEDTSVHLQRMSNYTAAIARKIGLNRNQVSALLYASPMHDIGKIGIPDRILLKPGKLNAEEWAIMRQHTVFAAKILEGSDNDIVKLGEVIALCHHEKWDGTGYPKGLKGKDIPLEGRIVAIADVFDALTSKRPYKAAFSNEKAFSIIQEGRGSHFDPTLLDAFFGIQDEILRIKNQYRDNHLSSPIKT